MPQLPITSEVILTELCAVESIVNKWEKQIRDNGIPGIDAPGPQDVLEDYLRSFCGELMLVAAKCEAMSRIISGEE